MSNIVILSVALLVPACALAAPADEFIRVGDDHWSFVTRDTNARFVPFGVNFALGDKRYLNMFGPDVYDAGLYERILAALESLGVNVVKVFLPIAQVLPDPQAPGDGQIAPGYLDNLDEFLRMARQHNLRAIVTLTSWGGNRIKWWHEGGEYFGRKPWKQDEGIDSLDVLAHFWTKLCTRFRDDSTVFAWNPAVEWSFPAGNLTWIHPKKQQGRLTTEQGMFSWRAFLRARHGDDIAKLNEAYGTQYASFDEVAIVDYTWNGPKKGYADPDAKILDYQNFRQWATNRYFKPQIAAIRKAAPNHMVTIGNHSRQCIGAWPGAARYAYRAIVEQSELVDYLSLHQNIEESYVKRLGSVDAMLRRLVLNLRFCVGEKPMPVMLEEYSYQSTDLEKIADVQERMVLATVGHGSGTMGWFLRYGPDSRGKPSSGLLHENLTPTPWGLRAKALAPRLQRLDLSRKPAATVVKVDREKALVPYDWGHQHTIANDWDKYQQPVDFKWPRNPWLNLRLMGE